MFYHVLLPLILLGIHFPPCDSGDCKVLLQGHRQIKFPVIFVENQESKKLDYYRPKKGQVRVKEGNSLVLLCSGPNNQLQGFNVDTMRVTCLGGSIFMTKDGLTQPLLDYECRKTVAADLIQTHESCGEGGVKTACGYWSGGQFLPLYYVCYVHSRERTVYSFHRTDGTQMTPITNAIYKRNYKSVDRWSTTMFDIAYSLSYQRGHLEKILKSSSARGLFTRKSFLAKAALTPMSDFGIGSAQFATFYYENTAPMWIQVKTGNWILLHEMIRMMAIQSGILFDVYTGVYGNTEIVDACNQTVELNMLPSKRLPVPKYFWKFIITRKERLGIAFVILNNPFATKVELFCESVCIDYDWYRETWTQIAKGYIVCCDPDDFLRRITWLPDIEVLDALAFGGVMSSS